MLMGWGYPILMAKSLFVALCTQFVAILRGYLLPQVPHHPICEKRPHRVLFLSGGMLHLGEGECVRIHTYIYVYTYKYVTCIIYIYINMYISICKYIYIYHYI